MEAERKLVMLEAAKMAEDEACRAPGEVVACVLRDFAATLRKAADGVKEKRDGED